MRPPPCFRMWLPLMPGKSSSGCLCLLQPLACVRDSVQKEAVMSRLRIRAQHLWAGQWSPLLWQLPVQGKANLWPLYKQH